MPVSRKRKSSNLGKRKIAPSNETKFSVQRIRIRRHKFREVRDNPDFLALVKIGRALNAVTSGLQSIADYIGDNSPIGHRQYNRAFFTTSGFLYEGLEVVTSIRLKYITEPFFDNLNLLIGDKYKRHRKVLKEIRHLAFHLDSDDKSTRLALSNLKLRRYDLMSGKSDKTKDFYFELADTIDFNYLIDKFKDNRLESEILEEILKLSTELMTSFTIAGH